MSAVNEFLVHEGVVKEAAPPSPLKQALVQGAGIAASTLATYATMEAVTAAKDAVQRSRGFKKMLETNPEMKEMDASGVKSMYNLMYRTAPTMAMDPYVASGFVKRIERGKSWIDPKVVSDLADTEAKIQRSGYGAIAGMPLEVGMAVGGRIQFR